MPNEDIYSYWIIMKLINFKSAKYMYESIKIWNLEKKCHKGPHWRIQLYCSRLKTLHWKNYFELLLKRFFLPTTAFAKSSALLNAMRKYTIDNLYRVCE